MKVLVACEFSGIVRNAFIARGPDADNEGIGTAVGVLREIVGIE
jgi:hypothetical protein